EVVRLERDVGIQTADQVERPVLDGCEAGVECIDLAGVAAIATLRHSNQLDPVEAPAVSIDDLVGIVCRAVANDDPPQRRTGLPGNRLQRVPDEAPFVARGRDQNVTEWPKISAGR